MHTIMDNLQHYENSHLTWRYSLLTTLQEKGGKLNYWDLANFIKYVSTECVRKQLPFTQIVVVMIPNISYESASKHIDCVIEKRRSPCISKLKTPLLPFIGGRYSFMEAFLAPSVNVKKSAVTRKVKSVPIKTYLLNKGEAAREKYTAEKNTHDLRPQVLKDSTFATKDERGGDTSSSLKAGKSNIDSRMSELASTDSLIASDADFKNLFSIDCEMVQTTKGSEIARISCVNAHMCTLLDTYVQPTHPVVDYRSTYSGVTPDKLKQTTFTFYDMQRTLKKLITPETIIVGHSVHNDIKYLHIEHDRFIDTSVLYPGVWPNRRSLSQLASNVLGVSLDRSISHDSLDDAKTAMRLVLEKVKYGPTYKIDMTESKKELLSCMITTTSEDRFPPNEVVICVCDTQPVFPIMGVHSECVSSDTEVLEYLMKKMHDTETHNKIRTSVGVLRGHYPIYGNYNIPENDPKVRTADFLLINAQISEIHAAAHKTNSCMFVVSPHGEELEYRRLYEQQRKWGDSKKETELTKQLQRARTEIFDGFVALLV